MIDAAELDALEKAIDGFDEAFVGLVQAAKRIIVLGRMDLEKPGLPRMAKAERLEIPTGISRAIIEAKQKGHTGDVCGACGGFTVTRVGTCLQCACGWSSGCG